MRKWTLSMLIIGIITVISAETSKCKLRESKYGFVCVCSTDYCDFLENPSPSNINEIVAVSSSKVGLRFETNTLHFNRNTTTFLKDFNEDSRKLNDNYSKFIMEKQSNFDSAAILIEDGRTFVQFGSSETYFNILNASPNTVQMDVDRSKIYQKIVGFGGAFTGSVSYILDLLNQPLQDNIYKSFYHADGIGYNMLRMSIGGSDFDLQPWAYNETPRDDLDLSNFTKLDPLDEVKLKQMRRLKRVAQLNNVKIMAAAWSSPTWMKSNNRWTGFSHLKTEYYQTWANYHLKFIELMDANDLPIWAISTGNEPLNGVIAAFFVHFMSLGWTPRQQAIWLTDHLGPTIKNSKFSNVLIFGNDDQRYTYPSWFKVMKLTKMDSLDYLDGLAVHWYWDELVGPGLIDAAHREMPEKLLINTESSIGDKPWQTHGPELGSWQRGEMYMRNFLQDFQHSFNGWFDWNFILNEQGGPNYVQNFVDAPIIVNTTNRLEFYKQPIFYAIGHFSKFLSEGSIRIDTQLSNKNLDAVAFLRPDESICIIILNSKNVVVELKLTDTVRGSVRVNLPPNSMHTIIYR